MFHLRYFKTFAAFCAVALMSACGGGGGDQEGPPVASEPLRVVAFGDSLTAGEAFVSPPNLWVQHVQRQLNVDGIEATVYNEGRGGETSSEALTRLPGVLARYKPTHIILAHGTNDLYWYCPGCYDLPETNLKEMIRISKAAGVEVILAEFTFRARSQEEAAAYTAAFQRVQAATGVSYVNMTSDVPLDSINYHPDRVHLTDAPQSSMAIKILQALYQLID
ncbi:MAG: SGNH/GDSL hydrolase family protein [Gammaproteobacteria bacterium]